LDTCFVHVLQHASASAGNQAQQQSIEMYWWLPHNAQAMFYPMMQTTASNTVQAQEPSW
jgi:hypothetical protein